MKRQGVGPDEIPRVRALPGARVPSSDARRAAMYDPCEHRPPGRNAFVVDEKHAEMHDPANGEACVDRYENCRQRARNGECENGPGWMIMYCSRACGACHLRSEARGRGDEAPPPLSLGALLARGAQHVGVPRAPPGRHGQRVRRLHRRAGRSYSPRVLIDEPFVATLDDFISDAEIDAILGSVSSQFARSTDQGAVDKCGRARRRTSSSLATLSRPPFPALLSLARARALSKGTRGAPQRRACSIGPATCCPRRRRCSAASLLRRCMCRARGATTCPREPREREERAWRGAPLSEPSPPDLPAPRSAVPIENFENFQILRYLPGQYYRTHHDMSENDNRLASGPRIYTFFLYLSDVEEGGETNFPRLDLDVAPRKGSALLWPSVLDDQPTRQEPKTFHQAKPVIKGTKFAANSWIHMYNYREPNLWGCTGALDARLGRAARARARARRRPARCTRRARDAAKRGDSVTGRSPSVRVTSAVVYGVFRDGRSRSCPAAGEHEAPRGRRA